MKNLPPLKNPYTLRGFEFLRSEHTQLVKTERPSMVQNMATAAAEGDRSENAEYIYSKKRIREIDSRIRYLEKLLKDAQVIDPKIFSFDFIFFGAIVTLQKENTVDEITYQIVGRDEPKFEILTVSWLSPLGNALLGKKINDDFFIQTPNGKTSYKIINFTYS